MISFFLNFKEDYYYTKWLDLVDFSRGFILPVSPMLQRPLKGDSTGARAIINTATTIPAFIGVHDNWRLAFFGIRYIHIYLADFHTMVAPVTDFGIKNHRATRCSYIRKGDYFFFRHLFLQKSVQLIGVIVILNSLLSLIYSGVVFIMGFILFFHVAPERQR